jgi:hypothetical protein
MTGIEASSIEQVLSEPVSYSHDTWIDTIRRSVWTKVAAVAGTIGLGGGAIAVIEMTTNPEPAAAEIVLGCDEAEIDNEFKVGDYFFNPEHHAYHRENNTFSYQSYRQAALLFVNGDRHTATQFIHGDDILPLQYPSEPEVVKLYNLAGEVEHEFELAKPDTCDYPFTDVPETSFAYDDILQIFEQSITTGTSETTYSPGDNVTRGQMAAFLARLYQHETGVPINYLAIEDHGFNDVPNGQFYSNPVKWLKESGITKGKNPETYAPNDFINRGEMAAMLARFVKQVELGVEIPAVGGPLPFTDIDPDAFFVGDVAVILELGITTGTSLTTFSPSDLVTREQMAAFMGRTERTVEVG